MKTIFGLNNIKNSMPPSIVTVGVFDGVHIAHKKIIEMAVLRAKRLGIKSAVLTFDPHPARMTGSGELVPTLISLEHRIRLIKSLGVDLVVVARFTKPFSRITPEHFADSVLAGKMSAREVYVGENFYFGKGAGAGARALKKMSCAYGFSVKVVKSVRVRGHVVSSSLIRRSISSGDLKLASELLGRPVSVLGTVVAGARLARQLGYPTANLNPHHEVVPPGGVYAVKAVLAGKAYGGVLNIGLRPTFYNAHDREIAIEVHIFGFRKRIYGKIIEVYFIKKIRDEVRFKSTDGLVAQIVRDASAARSILKI